MCRLIIHDLLYEMCRGQLMTQTLFEDFWKLRDEVQLIHKLRFTEQLPIYEYIASQSLDLQLNVLDYALHLNRPYLERVVNCWLSVAISNLNIPVSLFITC